jgi:hypothetical protein
MSRVIVDKLIAVVMAWWLLGDRQGGERLKNVRVMNMCLMNNKRASTCDVDDDDCVMTIANKTLTDVLRRLDQPTLVNMKWSWVTDSAISVQDLMVL